MIALKKILLLMFLLLLPVVHAIDTGGYDVMILNSADWKDVYSGMLYSKIKEIPAYYFTSETQAQNIISGLPAKYRSILLIENDGGRISPTAERPAN